MGRCRDPVTFGDAPGSYGAWFCGVPVEAEDRGPENHRGPAAVAFTGVSAKSVPRPARARPVTTEKLRLELRVEGGRMDCSGDRLGAGLDGIGSRRVAGCENCRGGNSRRFRRLYGGLMSRAVSLQRTGGRGRFCGSIASLPPRSSRLPAAFRGGVRSRGPADRERQAIGPLEEIGPSLGTPDIDERLLIGDHVHQHAVVFQPHVDVAHLLRPAAIEAASQSEDGRHPLHPPLVLR